MKFPTTYVKCDECGVYEPLAQFESSYVPRGWYQVDIPNTPDTDKFNWPVLCCSKACVIKLIGDDIE